MTAKTQLALALALSLVWAVAFVVGVATDAFYPLLGTVAALVIVVATPALVSAWAGATWRSCAVQVAAGAVVGIVTVFLTHVGYDLCAGRLPGLVEHVARLQRLAAVTPARLGLVVVIAVAEELLWRRGLLDALRQLGVRPVVAVGVSSLVYAGSQLGPGSPWLVLAGVGFGVLWGALRLRAGLWAAVVAHLVWTLAILGLVPPG